jgi:hypothetical protein
LYSFFIPMLNLWNIFRKSQGFTIPNFISKIEDKKYEMFMHALLWPLILRTKLPIALNQFQIWLWFWCFVIVFSVFYLLIIVFRIIYPFFTPTAEMSRTDAEVSWCRFVPVPKCLAFVNTLVYFYLAPYSRQEG